MAKGKLSADVLVKKPANKRKDEDAEMDGAEEGNESGKKGSGSDLEFKLWPFNEEDPHLKMSELPKKLKVMDKTRTVLTIKKHIHNHLAEPIDNIEILCKNISVPDSHTLEFVKRTKWQ